jgi:arsenate reductase (thioredoxin)
MGSEQENQLVPHGAETVSPRMAGLTLELETYLNSAQNEYGMIPAERKQQLAQLARYIEDKVEAGLPARLTFVCTHNSRRSQLSQVWAKVAADWYGVNGIETFSGGTEATAFNPRAVAAIRRAGLIVESENDTASNPCYQVRTSTRPKVEPQICFSKRYDSAPNPTQQYCAVMTCTDADENCPLVMGCDFRIPIRYDDPKVADDTNQEAAKYDERSRQICREMMYLFSLMGKGKTPFRK